MPLRRLLLVGCGLLLGAGTAGTADALYVSYEKPNVYAEGDR